jgi:hypothetical protein
LIKIQLCFRHAGNLRYKGLAIGFFDIPSNPADLGLMYAQWRDSLRASLSGKRPTSQRLSLLRSLLFCFLHSPSNPADLGLLLKQ